MRKSDLGKLNGSITNGGCRLSWFVRERELIVGIFKIMVPESHNPSALDLTPEALETLAALKRAVAAWEAGGDFVPPGETNGGV